MDTFWYTFSGEGWHCTVGLSGYTKLQIRQGSSEWILTIWTVRCVLSLKLLSHKSHLNFWTTIRAISETNAWQNLCMAWLLSTDFIEKIFNKLINHTVQESLSFPSTFSWMHTLNFEHEIACACPDATCLWVCSCNIHILIQVNSFCHTFVSVS